MSSREIRKRIGELIILPLLFVLLSSYGSGTGPTGEVYICKDVELPLQGRGVPIVADNR